MHLITHNGSHPYAKCSVMAPEPFFDDRTAVLEEFWSDIKSKSYKLHRWLCAMNPKDAKPIMLPDTMCP